MLINSLQSKDIYKGCIKPVSIIINYQGLKSPYFDGSGRTKSIISKKKKRIFMMFKSMKTVSGIVKGSVGYPQSEQFSFGLMVNLLTRDAHR